MSVRNLIHKGCYLDLNYIYSELSNAGGENPLDCASLLGSQADYYAVATNAVTGEARYFTKNDISQDHIAMYFTKDDENSTAEDEAKAAELIQAITQAAKTGQFTPEMEGMVEELNGLKAVIKDKKSKQSGSERSTKRMEEIMITIEELKDTPIAFDNYAIRQIIDCIKVISEDEITIIFKGGFERVPLK